MSRFNTLGRITPAACLIMILFAANALAAETNGPLPAAAKNVPEAHDAKALAYPLTTCVVSSDTLDAKNFIRHTYQGREVRLCCEACIAEFDKDPAKYLKMLDEAVIKQQTPTYPLKTCLVSGGELGKMGKPIDYVYKGRLVRFCCKGCIKLFEKDPQKYLAKLDKAQAEAATGKTVAHPAGGSVQRH